MNRLTLQTTLFLLLISLSFAFTDMPSCITQYNLLGVNFTVTGLNDTFACGVPLRYMVGNWTSDIGDVTTEIRISDRNSTHIIFYVASTGGAPTTRHMYDVTPPDSGNYTAEMYLSAATSSVTVADSQTGGSIASSGILGGVTKYLNFTQINPNEYNLSSPDGSILINKTDALQITLVSPASPQNVSISWPSYNSTRELRFYGGNSLYFNASIKYLDYYMSLNRMRGKIVRSDGLTWNAFMVDNPETQYYCKAMVYYGGNTIYPKITYIPSRLAAYGYFYNESNTTPSGIAFIPNNTIVYVLDSASNTWYYVPALICDDFTTPYTISALYYSSAASYTTISMPLIPTIQSCSQSGNNYTITSVYPQTVTHVVYYNNGTDFNATSSVSSSFGFSINTNQYPNVNYTVNGVTTCWRSSNGTIMGSAINWPGGGFEKYVVFLPFLASLAVSTWNPFGLIFVAYIADAYQLFAPEITAGLIVIVAFISLLVNYRGAMTLKAVITYILIGVGIINYYVSFVAFSTCDASPLQQFAAALNSISLVSVESFLSSVPTFLVNIGGAILNVPGSFIGYALCMSNLAAPIFSSPLAFFIPLLQLSANIALLLLLYQIIANRFNLV